MTEPDSIQKHLVPPVLLAIVFFVIAVIFRIIDIFILQLHMTPFSIIYSKVIPLIILLVYVWIAYRKFNLLGIHYHYLLSNLILGFFVYVVYYLLPFLGEFYIELGLGLEPLLQLAFYPTPYIIYFIVFYIINSFMEEGVFRGLMMRCFMTKYNVNIANIIQAIFFGFWHIVWPINYLINGWIDPITAGWFAVYYVVSSFGFGIVTGYMFQKTSSLTGPIVLHTLWNFTIFMSVITYGVPPGWAVNIFLYGTMLAVEYIGLVIAILIIKEFSRQRKLPELTPWDATLPK